MTERARGRVQPVSVFVEFVCLGSGQNPIPRQNHIAPTPMILSAAAADVGPTTKGDAPEFAGPKTA